MRVAIHLLLALVATVCLAQAPDTNQKLLDEIKGLRTRLDRLVELLDAVERSQRAVLLQQVQVHETRLRMLEAQRDTLATQERDLSAQAANLGLVTRAIEAGAGPSGAPAPGSNADPDYRNETADRLASTTRILESTRGRIRSVDAEIASLRTRLTRIEDALKAAAPSLK